MATATYRECPYCHKHFLNVKNHIAMKHQTGADAGTTLTAADLLGRPEAAVSRADPKPVSYFCESCGAEVQCADFECPHCGEELAWLDL